MKKIFSVLFLSLILNVMYSCVHYNCDVVDPSCNDSAFLMQYSFFPTYTIGGTITGLTGSGLILTNNDGDFLTIPAGATNFTFTGKLGSGRSYNIQAVIHPSTPLQVCNLTANEGVVVDEDITNVSITCLDAWSVGGVVSGLLPGTNITLFDSNYRTTLSANGSFAFHVEKSGNYNISITSQPTNTRCIVQNGSSTALADVTNVVVTCPVVIKNGKNWMRCSHGQAWNSVAGDCTGNGVAPDYGAVPTQYCSTADHSCNDANPLGEGNAAFPVFGHLNGTGTSEAWSACNALNAGAGTYGINTWRVSRRSEIRGLVYCSNGTTLDMSGINDCGTAGSYAAPAIDQAAFPNTRGYYWTASASTLGSTGAYFILFDSGGIGQDTKTQKTASAYYVRCIAD